MPSSIEIPIGDFDLEGIEICGPAETFAIMTRIFFERPSEVDFDKAHFWTICLDFASKVLAIELVATGQAGDLATSPTDVFSLPVEKGASHVVLVHNQPTGFLEPSQEDKKNTNRLIKAGMVLHIEVIDHLIINEEGFFSFYESGVLKTLYHDPDFLFSFLQESLYRKELVRMRNELKRKHLQEMQKTLKQGRSEGRKQGIKKSKLAIAQNILAQGESIEKVSQYTGLSSAVLRKLQDQLESYPRRT